MKQVIVNIQDNRYNFFIELMKSMDFVSLDEQDDWYENISENEKKLIQKGIEDLDNGRIHTHEEVMALGKMKIAELKKIK